MQITKGGIRKLKVKLSANVNQVLKQRRHLREVKRGSHIHVPEESPVWKQEAQLPCCGDNRRDGRGNRRGNRWSGSWCGGRGCVCRYHCRSGGWELCWG